MNYLLYSSKEMFSSTELVRKSKMIFDKLLKKDIEKAIILRDGKPSFVMLDFNMYETLMHEFILLKNGEFSNNITYQDDIQDNDKINTSIKIDNDNKPTIDNKEKQEQVYIDEDLKEIDDYDIKGDESILDEFLGVGLEKDNKQTQTKQDNDMLDEIVEKQNQDMNKNEIGKEITIKDNTSSGINNDTDEIDLDALSDEERMELLKKEEEELKKTLEALETLEIGKKDSG